MKTFCAVFSCLFVLSFGAPSALAENDRRGDFSGQGQDRSGQNAAERRGESQRWITPSFPEGGQNGENGERKRQGKMSPDERRALRRQIDEAGSELYRSRR